MDSDDLQAAEIVAQARRLVAVSDDGRAAVDFNAAAKGALALLRERLPSDEPSVVELLAKLLAGLLEAERLAAEQTRRAERAEADALVDDLTGLYNRRGWDQLLAAEESRCRRHGHAACVVAIDLDGLKRTNDSQGHAAGDELLRRAATAIRAAVREQDVVARIGGDEFTVLGVECDAMGTKTLAERLQASLHSAGLEASLGFALRDTEHGLAGACRRADEAMYAAKRSRTMRRGE